MTRDKIDKDFPWFCNHCKIERFDKDCPICGGLEGYSKNYTTKK